ncbi:MAG: lipopolysaccharide assembly LapA domain-containing protein [Aquabacterium sp.]
MRILTWALRAFIFFALFAFALNNQQDATVHWFFGAQWRAPMVIIVLAAFAAGGVIGVLAMLPGWWKQRSRAARAAPPPTRAESAATDRASTHAASNFGAEHPPREGL